MTFLLAVLNEHLIDDLIFCSAIWITLGVLFGMAVIWALLTCITRYVTATIFRYFERTPCQPELVFKQPGPLSWSNWHLEMLVCVERGKPENPENNSQRRREPTTNSTHMWPESNPGHIAEHSHHCAIPAPYVRLNAYERERYLYGKLVNKENESWELVL